MASLKLAEITITMIAEYLQANFVNALNQVWLDRPDKRSTMEAPVNYFIYDPTHAYRRPAIILLCPNFDFRLSTGPNFINALAKVNVEAVVQDRDKESLTIKTWRYQCAMVHMLDNLELTYPDGSVKIICKVISTPFSGDGAVEEREPGDAVGVFAKGVMVELDVEHYEKKV